MVCPGFLFNNLGDQEEEAGRVKLLLTVNTDAEQFMPKSPSKSCLQKAALVSLISLVVPTVSLAAMGTVTGPSPLPG